MVLPADTEDELVEFLIDQNRNGEPLCRDEVDGVVLRALHTHVEVQTAGGIRRLYKPLSDAAKVVLAKGAVGQHFFNRFHANKWQALKSIQRRD